MVRLSISEGAFRYKCLLSGLETSLVYVIIIGLFFVLNWQAYVIWLTIICLIAWLVEVWLAFNYVRHATVQENAATFVLRRGHFIKRQIVIPKTKIYGIIKKENSLQNCWGLATLEIQTTAKIYNLYGLDKALLHRFMNQWQKSVAEK